jgi:hypothetical protein
MNAARIAYRYLTVVLVADVVLQFFLALCERSRIRSRKSQSFRHSHTAIGGVDSSRVI